MSTIKDVAKLAGVSTSTVSRALSNKIFVEEATRKKVMAAVEALGYRPNILAKGLKEGKTYTLAFLVPDIHSLYYPEIMKDIEEFASQKGYSVILCNCGGSIEREKKILEMQAARGIDGILCMSVADDVSHLVEFQNQKNIPVVLVNRYSEENISCITLDHEAGGYMMTKALVEQGHTKIAGVFGNSRRRRFRDRCAGCERAMQEAGIEDYKRFFLYDVDTIDDAYQAAAKLLEQPERPTVFFASMDALTLGIYRAIREKGLVIPRDISVVGFDNINITPFMMPPLTTFAEPTDVLAKRSVECLLEQISDPEKRFKEVLNGTLIFRESLQPRK